MTFECNSIKLNSVKRKQSSHKNNGSYREKYQDRIVSVIPNGLEKWLSQLLETWFLLTVCNL